MCYIWCINCIGKKRTFHMAMEVGEKVKNIFLEAAMNYDKMSDSEK